MSWGLVKTVEPWTGDLGPWTGGLGPWTGAKTGNLELWTRDLGGIGTKDSLTHY